MRGAWRGSRSMSPEQHTRTGTGSMKGGLCVSGCYLWSKGTHRCHKGKHSHSDPVCSGFRLIHFTWNSNRQGACSRSHTTAQLTSGNLLICHNVIIYIHANVPLDPIAVLTSVSWPKSISSHCMLPTEIPQTISKVEGQVPYIPPWAAGQRCCQHQGKITLSLA